MSDNNNKNNNNDFLEQKLQEAGFYSMSIKYKKNKRIIIIMKLIESNMFTKPENHDGYHNQRPKRKNADFKMKIIPPS
jgi:hypothetical protein